MDAIRKLKMIFLPGKFMRAKAYPASAQKNSWVAALMIASHKLLNSHLGKILSSKVAGIRGVSQAGQTEPLVAILTFHASDQLEKSHCLGRIVGGKAVISLWLLNVPRNDNTKGEMRTSPTAVSSV